MTQQTIGIGATANDRTGDTWRDAFDKTNGNFTELYTSGGLDNVVKVNSLADFPDPVDGVIELVTTPGARIAYIIGSVFVDVGVNRFTITDGQVVIRGMHRTGSRITSSTTGTMFTSTGSAFFQEFISFDCPNAKVFDFSDSTFLSFANNNLIIINCDTLGTIAGAFTTSLRTMTVVATQSGGFTWTGTAGSQINITNFLGIGWSGTLLDLGTATFDLINISSDCRFISPSGTTILSGAASSANLTASGRALVSGNIFNGVGTALNGITTQDLQWQFSGNVFVDGTTENTRRDADAYLLINESVANAGSDVYGPIAGGNWQSDISNSFTVDADGIITYIGLSRIDAPVSAAATVEKGGGGSALICCKIAIDTGSGFAVIDKTIGCTQNATPTQITASLITNISTGDRFQLFVAIDDGSSTIEVSNARMLTGGV